MSLSVTTSLPASGDIDVEVFTSFQWEFYNETRDDNWIVKSLDGISGVITDDMVELRDGNGTRVDGTVAAIYHESSSLSTGLQFGPDINLQYSTTYEITLPGSSSGVYGIPDGALPVEDDFLTEPYVYTFTTIAAPVVPPPTDPTASGSNVLVGGAQISDTAILHNTNHGRCIGPQGSVANNSQFLIEPDGTLRAVLFINREEAVLKSSTDNGFTWTNRDNIPPINRWTLPTEDTYSPGHGPRLALISEPNWMNNSTLITDNYYIGSSAYGEYQVIGSWEDAESENPWGELIQKYRSHVSDTFGKPNPNYPINDWIGDHIEQSYYASDSSVGDDLFYMVYSERNNKLTVLGQNVGKGVYTVQDYNQLTTKTLVTGALAIRSWRDKLHIICVEVGDQLQYIPYTKILGSLYSLGNVTGEYGTPITIASGTLSGQMTSFVEPTIAVDGQGNLCTHYTFNEEDYYSVSTDNGQTWVNIHNEIPSGYIVHTDILADAIAPSNDVLGLSSGFLVSTCFESDGSADLFVKEVPAYGLESGESTIDWNRVNSVTGDVIAGKFFRFTNEMKPNSSSKDGIRMVYQVGRNNEVNGLGTNPTTVYHERLTNLAYPNEFTGTAFTADNLDYYASGYIDENTQLYINKIDELGMDYSFTRYDPIANSTVNGKSGYEKVSTSNFIATVDPGSYGFPTVAKSNEEFEQYIERDTRKMFYQPNTYLERLFMLNKSGTLKRTIWTVRIMGNDYEVAQIVPRWLDGAIVYYEANLYVIGPSNDPFSKVILPSET